MVNHSSMLEFLIASVVSGLFRYNSSRLPPAARATLKHWASLSSAFCYRNFVLFHFTILLYMVNAVTACYIESVRD